MPRPKRQPSDQYEIWLESSPQKAPPLANGSFKIEEDAFKKSWRGRAHSLAAKEIVNTESNLEASELHSRELLQEKEGRQSPITTVSSDSTIQLNRKKVNLGLEHPLHYLFMDSIPRIQNPPSPHRTSAASRKVFYKVTFQVDSAEEVLWPT